MQGFCSLTVFILATNEQKLLRQTILSVVDACGVDCLRELVVVLPADDCPAASVCREFGGSVGGVSFRTYIQKNSDKVLFFSEIPFLAESSHFVIMAGDMEMDPGSLRKMTAVSKTNPEAIVCGAKWLKESSVFGYGFFHQIANVSVNRMAALLLRNRYKDLFSIFEIYPKSVFDRFFFQQSPSLLYEYTLKPVSRGAEYIEVPTVFRKRTEGVSNSSFRLYAKLAVHFILTAIRLAIHTHKEND